MHGSGKNRKDSEWPASVFLSAGSSDSVRAVQVKNIKGCTEMHQNCGNTKQFFPRIDFTSAGRPSIFGNTFLLSVTFILLYFFFLPIRDDETILHVASKKGIKKPAETRWMSRTQTPGALVWSCLFHIAFLKAVRHMQKNEWMDLYGPLLNVCGNYIFTVFASDFSLTSRWQKSALTPRSISQNNLF